MEDYIDEYREDNEAFWSEVPEFIRKIDWELLKEQKQCLLEISVMGCFTEKDYDMFEGILALIDSIQDYGVDELGIDEKDVFNHLE